MDTIDERAAYLETYEGFDIYYIIGEHTYAATWEKDGTIIETDDNLNTLRDYISLEYSR